MLKLTLHIALFYSVWALRASSYYECYSATHKHSYVCFFLCLRTYITLTFAHTYFNGCIWGDLGFNIFPKDTLTYMLEEPDLPISNLIWLWIMESVRLTSGWVVMSLSYQVLPSREEIQKKVKTNQQTEASTGGKKMSALTTKIYLLLFVSWNNEGPDRSSSGH